MSTYAVAIGALAVALLATNSQALSVYILLLYIPSHVYYKLTILWAGWTRKHLMHAIIYCYFYPTDGEPLRLSVSSALRTEFSLPVCTAWPFGLCTRRSYWLYLPSKLQTESKQQM